jgi:hypothetical protein
LKDREGKRLGALLLARDGEWDEQEIALLTRAADFYGHAWAVLHRPSPVTEWKLKIRSIPRYRLKLNFPLRRSATH